MLARPADTWVLNSTRRHARRPVRCRGCATAGCAIFVSPMTSHDCPVEFNPNYVLGISRFDGIGQRAHRSPRSCFQEDRRFRAASLPGGLISTTAADFVERRRTRQGPGHLPENQAPAARSPTGNRTESRITQGLLTRSAIRRIKGYWRPMTTWATERSGAARRGLAGKGASWYGVDGHKGEPVEGVHKAPFACTSTPTLLAGWHVAFRSARQALMEEFGPPKEPQEHRGVLGRPFWSQGQFCSKTT